ncbi:hypothetical protein [Streptomyces atacamensis]|uniref:hypothetical protein n=1 Tax=Streptomyces atacamensis TaxID=531966 RepID=UPI00399C6E8E
MQGDPSAGLMAGVVVTLAFFLLIAYLVKVLHTDRRLPRVIIALGGLVGALPAILYALYYYASHVVV